MRCGFVYLCGLAWFAAGISAQETHYLQFGAMTPKGRQLRATVDSLDAGIRSGGFGFVAVELENSDHEKHRVKVVLEPASSRYRMYLFSRQIDLEPGATGRVFLPLPNGDVAMAVNMSVDGYDNRTTRINRGSTGPFPSVLVITEDQKAHVGWEAVLKGIAISLPAGSATHSFYRSSGAKSILLQRRAPYALPPRWDMLSGFDSLIVDGRSIRASDQGVLHKYLRAGGSVLVYYADVMPEGALTRDWQEAFTGGVQHGTTGFGTWLAIDSESSGSLPATLHGQAKLEFDRWLGTKGVGGVFEARDRPVSGPVTCKGFLPEKIPGLNKVSLRVFFLFTLVFGVLVGPVSYFYWWRKRKLPMLLLSVPVFGFGCTAVVLLYGLFSEGFGVKGVIRSVTILDQAEHDSVSWSSRTLYAGLAPGALQPAADTFLASLHLNSDWRAPAVHTYSADFTNGRKLGGGLVPSRYQTCLAAVNQGTARDRLRVRRRDDGDIDLLSTPEFQTSRKDGDIVFRDFRGDYYIQKADRLILLDRSGGSKSAKARAAIDKLLVRWDIEGATRATPAGPRHIRYAGAYQQQQGILPNHASVWATQNSPKGFWTERVNRVLADGMELGSYVAIVASDPGVDDLGLDVDWLQRRHLVIGKLSKEDVVE